MKWIVGALAFLAIALVFRLSLLVYSMYVLLALLVLSRFLARRWIEGLSAERECNRSTAEIGDTVAVNITVRNRGSLPVAWVLAEDLIPKGAILQRPPRLAIVGKRLLLNSMRRDSTQRLNYQVRFEMRGYYQIGPLLMETGDLFGLHRRYSISAPPSYVLVYPKVMSIEGYDLASRRPIGEVRLTHRLYEDPTRIDGVRKYQPGDSFNRVHWRATARTGELHSKIYEPSTVAGATLLLDFHKLAFPARDEPIRSELAVTTAASLAHAVYQLGQQVGLATNGRDAADRIRLEGWSDQFQSRNRARDQASMSDESDRLRPTVVETRRGPEQFMRILDALARVELTDGLEFAEFVLEVDSRLPRDATVVAILGDVTARTALALGSLKRRGLAVTAMLIAADENAYLDSAARLMAERIEVRKVDGEASLADLCRRQMVR